MIEATLVVDPSSDAFAKIASLQDVLKHLRPALQDVGDMQMKSLEEQYSSEGSAINGSRWTARTRDYSWPILNKTGKMKGAHSVSELTDSLLVISNPTPYFKYHQKGTGKMPQRQVHGHSERMVLNTLEIVSNYIVNKAQNG